MKDTRKALFAVLLMLLALGFVGSFDIENEKIVAQEVSEFNARMDFYYGDRQ